MKTYIVLDAERAVVALIFIGFEAIIKMHFVIKRNALNKQTLKTNKQTTRKQANIKKLKALFLYL